MEKTGMERALELIEECKRTKSEFLDLGNLGLIEIPMEVVELNNIKSLNLGWHFLDKKHRIRFGQNDSNRKHRNKITDLSILLNLKSLESLFLASIGTPELNILKKMENLTSLDVSGNNIVDTVFLKSLQKLQKLNLSDNPIGDFSFFKQMGRLSSLILRNCHFVSFSFLRDTNNLTSLDLKNNGIENISFLRFLTKLKNLYLSGNLISNLSYLRNLENLENLHLSGNQIQKIYHVKYLSKLKTLYLSNNSIWNISALENLENLSELYLSSNRILDLSYLKNLKNLKVLKLSSNHVSDISFLENLVNLEDLDLNYNKVVDILMLGQLTKLKTLDLGNNYINDISPLKKFIDNFEFLETEKDYIVGKGIINLAKNPLNNPPIHILHKGIPAIQRYFKQLQIQGKEKIHEARILIVGEGKAGKTTLVKKFFDVNYPVPSDEDETVGIQITEGHPLPYAKDESVDFRTHIWDFGGQEIQYMTHQFFLTPDSLYVLVVDDREESMRLPYWFHTIRLLGSEQREGKMEYSPVLVVLNKKKASTTGVNYDALKYDQNFPDLKKIVRRIDFSQDSPEDIAALNQEITRLVCKLPIVGREVPKQWKPIRVALREEGEPYISLERFREICRENRIEDPLDQDQVSWYLHKLGYIIHFQEEDTEFALRDTLILQPKWALTAIYDLLLHKDIEQEDGIFTHKQMKAIWADYSDKEQNFLLKLMSAYKFDLIFQLEGRQRRYLAPVRLSKATPKFTFEEKDALRFRYDFEFMPEGIITRLIVREGQAIKKNPRGKRLVWKTGVVLEDAKTGVTMLVKEGLYPQQIIDILITGGSHAARVDGLARIRSGIDNILGTWFENAKYDQLVPCNCAVCLTLPATKRGEHNYTKLWERLYKGVNSQCNVSDEQVSPMKLLKGVDTMQKLNEQRSFERYGLDVNVIHQNPRLERIMREEGHSIRANTDRNAARILEEIPLIFRQELNETERTILQNVFEKIENVRLDVTHTQQLIEVIGKGVDEIIDNMQDDVLATEIFKIQRQLKKDDVQLSNKLKVSLPLIPMILRYERELSGDIFDDLKRRWREGGWKAIFVEDGA